MLRHAPEGSRSYWQLHDPASEPSGKPVAGNQKTDVVVIGAGITGLIAALFLQRAGKTVMLLEGRSLRSGETPRSTAHLTEVLDTRFHRLIPEFGIEKILRYSEAHRMAIQRLGSLIEELEGPGGCGWARMPGYLYCETENQAEELRKELSALDQLKIPCALVKHVPLPFSVSQAIRIENQAQVNPHAVLRTLAGAFVAEGGSIFEESRATEISPIRNGVRVTTSGGVITCEHCIVSTHSPVIKPSVAHLELTPRRTYVMAVKLRNAPLMDGLFWDLGDPYHYLRMANGHLIAGGEDHRVGESEQDPRKSTERLEDYVRSRFEVESIPAQWSGQIFESVDGLPLVGSSLRSPRIFYATGYSGNGISQGTLAGMLLSELALGRREDLARLLSPHRRLGVRDVRTFLSNNIVYPANLASSLLQPVAEKFRGEEDLDPAQLAPGEAKVGTIDGKRVASYRDSEGRLQTVSARCTHLGGEVTFNSFEKTWDCNCHGSRFGCDGEVISGPAKTPLQQFEVERAPSEQVAARARPKQRPVVAQKAKARKKTQKKAA